MNPQSSPWGDFREIDDVIHVPARLAILSFLFQHEKAKFNTLKDVLGVTSGNLSSHLKRLELHGLIEIEKRFVNAKPTTIIHITEKGKDSLQHYATKMVEILTNLKRKDNSQKDH